MLTAGQHPVYVASSTLLIAISFTHVTLAVLGSNYSH